MSARLAFAGLCLVFAAPAAAHEIVTERGRKLR
jgi:hypothetical protein